MSLLKRELIHEVSEQLVDYQKQDIALAVEIILEEISLALSKGRRVEIRGFGSFSIRTLEPRITKNPKTGKMINIPALHHEQIAQRSLDREYIARRQSSGAWSIRWVIKRKLIVLSAISGRTCQKDLKSSREPCDKIAQTDANTPIGREIKFLKLSQTS